jgi:dextranase
VSDFIAQAHRYNMVAMAYNASYGAYEDVFTRPSNPLPLRWATWTTADSPRSAATAKNLPLQASGWSTHFLYYMNQNDAGWQRYLFSQMRDLFAVYPFDGWHVDTYGDQGGYALDGSRVDYIAGFRSFIDHARADLGKPVVFNTVNALGQDQVAHSSAEFVYSELWDDHETFASILETAEQVHLARPGGGVVFAAYVNRNESKDDAPPSAKQFNAPSVLLTDAAIFASGAAHIELGDGDRMLSSEYFPADTRLAVSPALHTALRHYYDYLTAYENYLRGDVQPAAVEVHIDAEPADPLAVPNTIWTIARRNQDTTMLHLINLLGSNDPHWRDIDMERPEPPLLNQVPVKVRLAETIRSVGWASPDVDDGQFHPLPFRAYVESGTQWIEFSVPQLKYWDTIFLSR